MLTSADSHFHAVVVGSGFGGAVSAYRLADAGQRVCVLERGKAYPPGSFPRRPREMAANFWDPSRGMHGLFNAWSFRGIEALVSSGLGGGSLIYANVLLRKDERWFVKDAPFPGGAEHWPISRADLDPHYDQVESMLGATPLPFGSPGYDLAKTKAMQEVALRHGLDWKLPNLAVSFASGQAAPRPGDVVAPAAFPNLHGRTRTTCRLCGECDIGCNDGAKNTLDHTYLSAAVHRGAEVRTRCEVRRLAPRPGGGFTVSYVEHRPEHEGTPTDTAKLPHVTITADRLVLAAGTLGTTYLLLRNVSALRNLGPALGTRFCGNGDLLTFALRAHRRSGPRWSPLALDASRGPVITSAIRLPDAVDGPDASGADGRGYYVEDAGYPTFVDWMLEGTRVPSTINRLVRFAGRRLVARVTRNPRSDLSAEMGALLGSAALSGGSLPLLGMGRDVPDGRMKLRKGHLDIDCSLATSKAYFDGVRSSMAMIAGDLGATFRDNPLWRFRRVITVHPLGGCPMGRHVGEGVVDAWGQSFTYPGLFVADGSVMPGPVGANPALTIAAFANRMAEHILETDSVAVATRKEQP